MVDTHKDNLIDEKIIFHRTPKDCIHSYKMVTILIENAKKSNSLKYKNKQGIQISSHFDPSFPSPKAPFKQYQTEVLPVKEFVPKRIFTLPSYNSMPTEFVEEVCKALTKEIRK